MRFNYTDVQWKKMYINGVLHNVTGYEDRFFADEESHKFRFCSQHTLPLGSQRDLESGVAIITSGNRYSLKG